MRVLVTGGTGVLGGAVVNALKQRGAIPRILSRQFPSSEHGVEWIQGDLGTGAGAAGAFAEVDAVIHAATSQAAGQDLAALQQALALAKDAAVRHFVYASIVGIDTLSFVDYYAAKLQGERAVAASGVPYSIQRATQFHEFVAFLLSQLTVGPLLIVPAGAQLQPVEVTAVAACLADTALAAPAGRLPDLAGPERLSMDAMARAWMTARRMKKLILPLPLPMSLFRAMRSGRLTSDTAERIGCRWTDWLAEHAAQPLRYRR